MKIRVKIFVVMLSMVYLQACTMMVLDKAEGISYIDLQCPNKGKEQKDQPNAWWYTLLPFATALDAAGIILAVLAFPMTLQAIAGGAEIQNKRCSAPLVGGNDSGSSKETLIKSPAER